MAVFLLSVPNSAIDFGDINLSLGANDSIPSHRATSAAVPFVNLKAGSAGLSSTNVSPAHRATLSAEQPWRVSNVTGSSCAVIPGNE